MGHRRHREIDESLESAAMRELEEETGSGTSGSMQLAAVQDPEAASAGPDHHCRPIRRRRPPHQTAVRAGDDAADVQLADPIRAALWQKSDHDQILKRALQSAAPRPGLAYGARPGTASSRHSLWMNFWSVYEAILGRNWMGRAFRAPGSGSGAGGGNGGPSVGRETLPVLVMPGGPSGGGVAFCGGGLRGQPPQAAAYPLPQDTGPRPTAPEGGLPPDPDPANPEAGNGGDARTSPSYPGRPSPPRCARPLARRPAAESPAIAGDRGSARPPSRRLSRPSE